MQSMHEKGASKKHDKVTDDEYGDIEGNGWF